MNTFSLDTPLLFFSQRDPWTVRDALAGTFCTGATGAGKTTGPGAALATAFLRAGFGGLVLTSKPDECALWQRYCAATGRTPSLIVFAPSGPWRFNFLDYELRRPGAGAGLTENLVAIFCTLLETAERQRGQRPTQDFWERTTKQLLRNCFDLLAIARGHIVLHEVYDLIVSAAQSPEETASEAWQRTSFCFTSIRQGETRPKTARQAN